MTPFFIFSLLSKQTEWPYLSDFFRFKKSNLKEIWLENMLRFRLLEEKAKELCSRENKNRVGEGNLHWIMLDVKSSKEYFHILFPFNWN